MEAPASESAPRGPVTGDSILRVGRRRAGLRWALAGVGSFALFALLYTRPVRLFDADSYLHLALARLLREQGFVSALSWARFSVLGQSYGDKELLFHLLLVPFTAWSELERAGQLALALLASGIALSLARLGSRALGWPGLLLALFAFGGSGSFVLRALRLRPELLALLLLLWILWALARERHLLALLLSCAFALAHTAFHSLLGLAGLWLVWQRWSERRWSFRTPLHIGAGVALGVVIHPRFPANLKLFWVQNVEFFRYKAVLDVGGEFQPHSLGNLLTLDALWLLGLAALVLAREPDPHPGEDAIDRPTARRMASVCWIAGVVFGALFLQMGRFATLAVPCLSLALAFELRARGLHIGARLRLPGGRSAPTAAVLAVLAPLALLNLLGTAFVNWQLGAAFDRQLSPELRSLSTLLPKGARVAASWDDAEEYAFFAPQARYLNLLDPVFMAVADPTRHAAWTALRTGAEPDVPRVLAETLDSDYLLYAAAGREALSARVERDPRLELLHAGTHRLYRLRAGGELAFARAWSPAPQAPSRAGVAGFVDASASLAADGCGVLAHSMQLETAVARMFELAAWGPTVLFIDGEQRIQLTAPTLARLGQGVALPVRLSAGVHRVKVRTCEHAGRAGFYLIDRGPL